MVITQTKDALDVPTPVSATMLLNSESTDFVSTLDP